MRRFPGSFISANTPAPAYGVNTAAPGIWNRQQQRSYKLNGSWPQAQVQSFLWGWGLNNAGQLGINNAISYSSPKQVGAGSNWMKVAKSLNGYSTFAVKSDGTLWSWGSGSYGVLGLGNSSSYTSPKQVGSRTDWKDVFGIGGGGFYAQTRGGVVYRTGNMLYGGPSNTNIVNGARSNLISGSWTSLSSSSSHAVGTRSDGSLWSWGSGTAGKLGLGNLNSYSYPKMISSSPWLTSAVGASHSVAIKNDGTIWTWGYNSNGQLGLGNTTSYSSPKQVGLLATWINVAASGSSTFAIKSDGTLWTWGNNSQGQLGLGNTTNYSSPKQVGLLTNWIKVSAGSLGTSTCVIALKSDGTLWSWGYNNSGQLGLGNTTNYSSPKQIGLATNWLDVFSTSRTVHAIRGI